MRSITDIPTERIIGVARVPRAVPVVFGIAAGLAMLVIAIQRLPGAERIDVPKPTIAERFDAAPVEPLKKQDRVRAIDLARPVVAMAEPVPVKTETIRPDPAPAVPKLVALPEDALDETGPEPKYKHRTRERHTSRGGDVCSRHGQRKVMVGRYKWRCRR